MGSLTPFPFEGGGGAGGGLEGTAGGGPAAPLPAAGGGTDDGDHSTCVLVHNVSHTDMLVDLALDAAQGARYDFHARAGDAWAHRGCVLARPKFSSFDGISQRLLRAIDRLSDKHPVVVARDSDVYTDVPCGFDLSAAPVEPPRGRTLTKGGVDKGGRRVALADDPGARARVVHQVAERALVRAVKRSHDLGPHVHLCG